MIILRFRRHGIDQHGILDAGQVYLAAIDDAGLIRAGALVAPLRDITILPPTVPSKIIAVGLNYGDPSQEGLPALPDEPIVSFKPTSSVIGGDVILTGTPPGVGPLAPGDVVEVEIEGIGVLRNPVARSSE